MNSVGLLLYPFKNKEMFFLVRLPDLFNSLILINFLVKSGEPYYAMKHSTTTYQSYCFLGEGVVPLIRKKYKLVG